MTGSSGLVTSTAVVDDVAGMGDPLAAAHELVVDAVAEGVAHAAVIAGEANPAAHRGVRFSTSSFSIFDMVTIGTTRLMSAIAGSAKASVVFST